MDQPKTPSLGGTETDVDLEAASHENILGLGTAGTLPTAGTAAATADTDENDGHSVKSSESSPTNGTRVSEEKAVQRLTTPVDEERVDSTGQTSRRGGNTSMVPTEMIDSDCNQQQQKEKEENNQQGQQQEPAQQQSEPATGSIPIQPILRPFETPLVILNRSHSGEGSTTSSIDSVDSPHHYHPPLQEYDRPLADPISSSITTPTSSLRSTRRNYRGSAAIPSIPGRVEVGASVTTTSSGTRNVSFGPPTHPDDHHSISDSLADSSYNTSSDNDEDAETKSVDSVIVRQVSLAMPELDKSEIKNSFRRRSSSKTLQHSDRRVSLTYDMETGKTAGSRGQKTFTRSSSMMEAQSPRLRRRRGLDKILKTTRRMAHNVIHPDRYEESSSSDEDDNASVSKGHRGRFFVKSTKVLVPDEPTRNSTTGRLEHSEHEEVQYRLSALTSMHKQKFNLQSLGMYEDSTTQPRGGNRCICGWQPNALILRYLFWAFRNNFILVLLSSALLFYFITTFFAFIIYLIGISKPDCVYVNGIEIGNSTTPYMDAYALSWTTFSTVGYGLISPGTSVTASDARRCTSMAIVTTLESFVGILFASFSGAIFFAKVTRVASHAQVNFSDAIVVRYGTGITGLASDDEESSDEEQSSSQFVPPSPAEGQQQEASSLTLSGSAIVAPATVTETNAAHPFQYKPSTMPCPFLEFRVVNRLHGRRGGEIIDASMNIVASIDENQAALAVRNAARVTHKRRGKKGKRRPRTNSRRAGSSRGSASVGSHSTGDDETDLSDEKSIRRLQDSVRSMIVSRTKATAVDEDPTGKVVPGRIFAKLEVESQEHPFFKRTWTIRHSLDHNSPILRQKAKELVRLNGGHWPHELNNVQGVRASIYFDQILVSFSGTSNVDANSVYAQKVYDFVDVCVGYTFCEMLYRHEDGSIGVDTSLLNDVVEQTGGGGEDLDDKVQQHGKGGELPIFIL